MPTTNNNTPILPLYHYHNTDTAYHGSGNATMNTGAAPSRTAAGFFRVWRLNWDRVIAGAALGVAVLQYIQGFFK